MKKRNDAHSLLSAYGFSYAEMLLTTLLLALCLSLICDAMAFGVQYLQKRIRHNQALILLDTLCAAVRADLEYATKCYADGSIERVVRDYAAQKEYAVRTRYGVGQWRTDNPDSYFDETLLQWRGIQDSAASPGQIIRKSALSDGQSFFDCLSPPESYPDGICAAMDMTPILVDEGGKVDRFSVTVTLYDGSEIAAQRLDFVVLFVQPIPFVEK